MASRPLSPKPVPKVTRFTGPVARLTPSIALQVSERTCTPIRPSMPTTRSGLASPVSKSPSPAPTCPRRRPLVIPMKLVPLPSLRPPIGGLKTQTVQPKRLKSSSPPQPAKTLLSIAMEPAQKRQIASLMVKLMKLTSCLLGRPRVALLTPSCSASAAISEAPTTTTPLSKPTRLASPLPSIKARPVKIGPPKVLPSTPVARLVTPVARLVAKGCLLTKPPSPCLPLLFTLQTTAITAACLLSPVAPVLTLPKPIPTLQATPAGVLRPSASPSATE